MFSELRLCSRARVRQQSEVGLYMPVCTWEMVLTPVTWARTCARPVELFMIALTQPNAAVWMLDWAVSQSIPDNKFNKHWSPLDSRKRDTKL